MGPRPLAIGVALAVLGCASGGLRSAEPPRQAPRYQGVLRVDPERVDFGDTPVGCIRSVGLALAHSGTERALTVARVVPSDPALRVGGALPLTLRPGQVGYLELHFAPTEAGAVSGGIELATDESEALPLRVPFEGTGLARPTGAPGRARGTRPSSPSPARARGA